MAFKQFIVRDGDFAGRIFEDSHAKSVDWVATDSIDDAAAWVTGATLDNGEIFLAYLSLRKLFREVAVGDVVFGDNETSGRVFIEAVNNTWPGHAADSGKGFAVKEESVDQGFIRASRGRVNHHPGRLVHDQEAGIFEEDLNRYILGLDTGYLRLRQCHLYLVSGFEILLWLRGATVDENVSFMDETLYP
jgi:hypothetical protein